MKLRKLVTKVMGMTLACVLLMTTMPVMANEATNKSDIALKFSNVADSEEIVSEDWEAIMAYIGANTTSGGKVSILDENSGVYIDKENSLITGPTGENGCIWAVGLYGMNFTRDEEGDLVVAENNALGGGWFDTNDNWVMNEGIPFTGFEDAALGNKLINAIENGGFPVYDIYYLSYDYSTTNSDRILWKFFLIEDCKEDTVLKFVENTDDENIPTDGESYEVSLPEGTTSVSATEFSAILTENATKDVVIKSNSNVTFTFAKGTMSAVEGMENYDFGTSVVADFASAGTMSTTITADNFVTRINFNYSGKLPATASIKVFVGTEYAGQTLYYHKLTENSLTYITSAKVDTEGYIVVTQDSCSDYVLTTEKLVVEAPQTGDSSSVALWMMVAICGLGCVVCGLKSKKTA